MANATQSLIVTWGSIYIHYILTYLHTYIHRYTDTHKYTDRHTLIHTYIFIVYKYIIFALYIYTYLFSGVSKELKVELFTGYLRLAMA